MHWIKDNIGAFGGASGNITLMGTKRGALLVNLLMLSPMAKGKALESDPLPLPLLFLLLFLFLCHSPFIQRQLWILLLACCFFRAALRSRSPRSRLEIWISNLGKIRIRREKIRHFGSLFLRGVALLFRPSEPGPSQRSRVVFSSRLAGSQRVREVRAGNQLAQGDGAEQSERAHSEADVFCL